MFSSEKRSLVRFLIIYLTSTLLLFALAASIFYTSSKQHLLDKQEEILKYQSQKIESSLRVLHQSNAHQLHYPHSPSIDSAIYDVDKQYIFGSLSSQHTLQERKKGMLYHQTRIEPYYLGAAYLLTRKKVDATPISDLQFNVLFFMLMAGLFFSILGYYLGRLFVAPMRQSLEKMNHFIQDTTHELNTPISTILTNIEMIETFGKCQENHTELKRIEIASKTLSRIYDDLTYLNLNHQYHRDIISLDLSALIQERVVYFSSIAQAKGITTVVDILPSFIQEMDKNDAIRLIDNLLSNAIKYNKKKGTLSISLCEEKLRIEDTGIGINAKKLGQICQRFKRANKSEGGFGIGLHIVTKVCENYGYHFHIESTEHKGTEVEIIWSK